MPITLNQLWSVASSGVYSQQRKLEIISHNVANSSTVGFKASQAGFQAAIQERTLTDEEAAIFTTANPGDVVQEGMGAQFSQSTHLFDQGALQQTNDPLHLAIMGKGFFPLQASDGTLLYTRAGDFLRDAGGQLVNRAGHRLQPAVEIPEGVVDLYIDPQGRIMGRTAEEGAEAMEIGQIQIALFANPDGLQNVGENAFVSTEASGKAQLEAPSAQGRGTLLSGYLEGSNVDLGHEMVEMLRTHRSYSLSLKALRTADELFRLANELPRS